MKVGAASGAGAGGRAALAAASADGAGAAPKLKGAATGEAAAGTPKVKLLFAAPGAKEKGAAHLRCLTTDARKHL